MAKPGRRPRRSAPVPRPVSPAPQRKGAIRRNLLQWYRANARDLPWRRTKDPYAVWLSEILLQQTRVDQGTPYYERFLKQFPDVASLANASEQAVLKAWEGLGYYSRARNLHKAAKQIVKERAGTFPGNAQDWQTIPGVGRYTAGAIASIVYNEPVPVLDGNVIRVLTRVFDIDACSDLPAVKESLWNLAASLVPQENPGDFNQAMMELGARICTPREPACETCPVANQCEARAAGTQRQRPVRAPKKAVPYKELVLGAVYKNGRILIAKRPAHGLLAGLWELPGGELNNGETHAKALRRTLRETIGVTVKTGGLIASVDHAYSHLRVTLNVYRCDYIDGTPTADVHDQLKWMTRARLEEFPFPKAHHKFLHLL
jgi:A/G-specific adenine glycosylase